MRKIKWLVHTSLDGYLAGPQGEMDWIRLNEEIFDFVGTLVDSAGTALYGRVTYDMMQAYWPSAGSQPGAGKHDRQHSAWYNRVDKVVISRSMKGSSIERTRILSDEVGEAVRDLKAEAGEDILMLGSPSAAQELIARDLIDTYWLFVNPVLLGEGIPLFQGEDRRIMLDPGAARQLAMGVQFLEYSKAGG